MLISLIRYLAEDGDLVYTDLVDTTIDKESDISGNVCTVYFITHFINRNAEVKKK